MTAAIVWTKALHWPGNNKAGALVPTWPGAQPRMRNGAAPSLRRQAGLLHFSAFWKFHSRLTINRNQLANENKLFGRSRQLKNPHLVLLSPSTI